MENTGGEYKNENCKKSHQTNIKMMTVEEFDQAWKEAEEKKDKDKQRWLFNNAHKIIFGTVKWRLQPPSTERGYIENFYERCTHRYTESKDKVYEPSKKSKMKMRNTKISKKEVKEMFNLGL